MKQIWALSLLIIIVMSGMAMMVLADDSDVGFDIPCFLTCAGGCAAHQTIQCLAMCAERCLIPVPPPTSPLPSSHDMNSKVNPCKLACSHVECANISHETEKEKCMNKCYKMACADKG